MGYLPDYSMSYRAAGAYDAGLKPYSKWTRAAVLNRLADAGLKPADFAKYTADTLRKYFLVSNEWHHTSKLFRCTDFYDVEIPEDGVDMDELDALEAATRKRRAMKREARKHAVQQIVLAKVGEWEGSRNHPHLRELETLAIVVGSWAYLPGGRRKSTSGRHFDVLKTYSRAPRGHAAEINEIRKTIHNR